MESADEMAVQPRKRRWAEGVCEDTRTAVSEMQRKVSLIEQEHADLQKEFDVLMKIMSAEQQAKVVVKLEHEVATPGYNGAATGDAGVELLLPLPTHKRKHSSYDCDDDEASFSSSPSAAMSQGNEDMEVLFSRAPVTADFPHARPECYRHRFDKSTVKKDNKQNEAFCAKCFCFVCDVPCAECRFWTGGFMPHCDAHRSKAWLGCRDLSKVSIVPNLEDELSVSDIEKVYESVVLVQSIQKMAKNCRGLGQGLVVNLGCDCACHLDMWSTHCTYCSDNHPTAARLQHVIVAGCQVVQRHADEHLADVAAVLLHALVAAFLMDLPKFIRLCKAFGRLQEDDEVTEELWSKIKSDLKTKMESCKECVIKAEFDAAFNIRSLSDPTLKKLLAGTLEDSVKFAEAAPQVVSRVKKLVEKQQFAELCRYAARTSPAANLFSGNNAEEVRAFCLLRDCIPFCLAKLNKPMEAIGMLHHSYTLDLPSELFPLIGIGRSAGLPSVATEQVMRTCHGAPYVPFRALRMKLCPLFAVTTHAISDKMGSACLLDELVKIYQSLPEEPKAPEAPPAENRAAIAPIVPAGGPCPASMARIDTSDAVRTGSGGGWIQRRTTTTTTTTKAAAGDGGDWAQRHAAIAGSGAAATTTTTTGDGWIQRRTTTTTTTTTKTAAAGGWGQRNAATSASSAKTTPAATSAGSAPAPAAASGAASSAAHALAMLSPNQRALLTGCPPVDRPALLEAIVCVLVTWEASSVNYAWRNAVARPNHEDAVSALVDSLRLPEEVPLNVERLDAVRKLCLTTDPLRPVHLRPGDLASLASGQSCDHQVAVLEALAIAGLTKTINWEAPKYKGKLVWLCAVSFFNTCRRLATVSGGAENRRNVDTRPAEGLWQHYMPQYGLQVVMLECYKTYVELETLVTRLNAFLESALVALKLGKAEAGVDWKKEFTTMAQRFVDWMFDPDYLAHAREVLSHKDRLDHVARFKAQFGAQLPELDTDIVQIKVIEAEFLTAPTTKNLHAVKKICKSDDRYQKQAAILLENCQKDIFTKLSKSDAQLKCTLLLQICFEEEFVAVAVKVLACWGGTEWQKNLSSVAVAAISAATTKTKEEKEEFCKLMKPFFIDVLKMRTSQYRSPDRIVEPQRKAILDATHHCSPEILLASLQHVLVLATNEANINRVDPVYKAKLIAWFQSVKLLYVKYSFTKQWAMDVDGFFRLIRKPHVKKALMACN